MFLSSFWLSILVLMARGITSAIKIPSLGSSFSSVIKDFHYDTPGKEATLYERKFNKFGYVTEQWFAGGPFDRNARIRVYIDGENSPSIDYMLFLSQGLGTSYIVEESHTPWSTRMFGHNANKGGLFNTFRIPFFTGIKITMQNDHGNGSLWYIVRGVVGLPLMVGSFEIPANSRLRVYKQDKVLSPLEFITLSNSVSKSGILFLVTFNIESEAPLFLEGCVRAVIDGSNETTFLSSGTEDFFLSAFYFDRGEYRGFHSGLTFISKNATRTKIVAYKFFIDDPVIFHKSFKLIWRNYETHDGPDGCPSHFPPTPNSRGRPLKLENSSYEPNSLPKAHIQSYVWVYEWP